MSTPPTGPSVTAYARLGGIVWIPRMLQKIRLHAAGALLPDYQAWLGKGFDGRCCRFLQLDYAQLVERVRAGGTDEEIFAWIQEQRPLPSPEMIVVWNEYMIKRGWRDTDVPPEKFPDYKRQHGLGHRDDILTYFDFYEVDEGRAP